MSFNYNVPFISLYLHVLYPLSYKYKIGASFNTNKKNGNQCSVIGFLVTNYVVTKIMIDILENL